MTEITLQCRDVFEEQDHNKIYIKDLNKSITHNMRWYWSSKKSASLQKLAFHATFTLKLHGGSQPSTWFDQIDQKNQNRRLIWRNRGSTVSLIASSKTGTTTPGIKCGIDSKVTVHGASSKSTSFTTPSLLYHVSSTKPLLSQIGSCQLCFAKKHRMLDYPLVLKSHI